MWLTPQTNLNPLIPPRHSLWIQTKMPASWINLTPSLWLMESYISSMMGGKINLFFFVKKSKNKVGLFEVLLDRNYWKMSSKSGAAPTGPFAISQKWPALPAVVDSAFEDLLTRKMYFFSGSKPSFTTKWTEHLWIEPAVNFHNDCLLSIGTRFWVYTGQSVLGPRSIEKLGLPSSIQKVEGALQRGRSKVLLFSGENYWRYVQ